MVMPLTNALQLTSGQESKDVSFSLTCNSSGGPVSSVIWTRDGSISDNTGPLVLTDASTASYTNVLEVNSRAPGTYTCQIRGPSHQVLSSMDFTVQSKINNDEVEGNVSSCWHCTYLSSSISTGITITIMTLDVYITHFPGVYISHNGVFIEHDTSILITDIGTSSPHQLVCTTDRTPCCTTSGAGNWFYPDGGLVMHTSISQEFGRDRSDTVSYTHLTLPTIYSV